MRACFSTELYFKSEFKKSRARFFSSQIPLAEETKKLSLARPVFNLKAIEFRSFFAYFHLFRHLKAGPPLEAILVIFGRRALIFFVWKVLEKNEKWRHFCAHAQWWSPWIRKNVEKGHLAPSNLTFLLIAIDTNGFRRMKEEGLFYKNVASDFLIFALGLSYDLSKFSDDFTPFFRLWKTITKSVGKN